jgi:hypothetical protein
LFGVTGSIHIHARRTIIDSDSPLAIALFESHTRSEIGALPSDEAGISQMFWLSVGCISAPGSKIYSLDDVVSIDVEEEASKPTGLHRTSTRVMDEIDHDDYDDGQDYRTPDEVNRTASNTYVVPNITSLGSRNPHEPRAFRLSTITHRVAELTEVAASINVGDSNQTYSLEEIKCTDQTISELKEASKAKHMPLDLPWVRFDLDPQEQERYLRREDAHLLTHALLAIPMSPLGYLVGGDKKSKSRTLLCAAY